MAKFEVTARIPAPHISSLLWAGQDLIDWAGGGALFRLDGSSESRRVSYAFRFDAACSSPSGRYSVIYERLGTKGLLLRGLDIVRELNRSFYHANVYEFPVCFASRMSGDEVLIHCPEHYNELVIEDVETGERLTEPSSERNPDVFHSRLAVDPSQRWLLSTGWVWHPVDVVNLFSLADALENPASLNHANVMPWQDADVASASFLSQDRLLLWTSDEMLDDDDDDEGKRLWTNSLAVWDVSASSLVSQLEIEEHVGTLMPVSDSFVVGFFEHPKLIDLRKGIVVDRLPELATGKQCSSIIHHIDPPPPLAIDASNHRFAVAGEKEIAVVTVLVD